MKRKLHPAAAVLLFTAAPFLHAREYVNAKFTPAEHTVSKVLIVPADVKLTKSGMKGSEGMAKESEQMSDQIMALVVKQLEGRHVQVIANPFTEDALRNDQEMQSTLTKIQSKYDTISTQLHAKPKEVKKGRYTLGDEVSTLRPAAEADAIVFIRGTGTVLTGGKKAFGVLVAGASANTIRTFVTIVDAKSGEVLAVVDFLKAGNFEKKSDKMMTKTLTNSFKKIPFSTN